MPGVIGSDNRAVIDRNSQRIVFIDRDLPRLIRRQTEGSVAVKRYGITHLLRNLSLTIVILYAICIGGKYSTKIYILIICAKVDFKQTVITAVYRPTMESIAVFLRRRQNKTSVLHRKGRRDIPVVGTALRIRYDFMAVQRPLRIDLHGINTHAEFGERRAQCFVCVPSCKRVTEIAYLAQFLAEIFLRHHRIIGHFYCGLAFSVVSVCHKTEFVAHKLCVKAQFMRGDGRINVLRLKTFVDVPPCKFISGRIPALHFRLRINELRAEIKRLGLNFYPTTVRIHRIVMYCVRIDRILNREFKITC